LGTVDLWFSSGTPISHINKTVRHDITEISLKVTLNTITLTLYPIYHNTNVMTLAIIFNLWCSVNISDIYKILFNYLIVNSSSLTNIHIMLYRVHLAWAGFELTTLVEIGTECIGTSNYHTITTVYILYILTMVLSVLRFTNSEYTFGIFKHFLKFIYLTLT
jgi:hypothetical protein